jgi:hypothetical protein
MLWVSYPKDIRQLAQNFKIATLAKRVSILIVFRLID